MMLLCDAHLHLAPLENPRRILDIGTGTGIWAIQMADDNPDCTVIGTDLSPVQPSWYDKLFDVTDKQVTALQSLTCFRVPDNVRFEIDDIEAKEWAWPDNSFDYIHSRFMTASIGFWPRLVRKAFQYVSRCFMR